MFNLKSVAAAGVLLTTAVVAPLCQAQTPTTTIKVVTAGSSAQWGAFAEAAEQLAKSFGTAHHWTVKGGTNAVLHDNRGGTVPDEAGNLWVVWSVDASGNKNVWAYLSVDSVVGVRAFQAAPKDTLVVTSGLAGQNLLSSPNAALFTDADDTSIDSTVLSALNNHAVTAANTDIRPEDALFATARALAPLDTVDWTGLGYAVNSSITDSTGGAAHVEPFALSGTDPVSGDTVAAFTTLPIGAAPIVFFANTQNTAAGHLGSVATLNVTNGVPTGTNNALSLFSGVDCTSTLVGASSAQPVTLVLREPTSGTMNTTEFTNFRTNEESFHTSQEANVTTNPLSQNCTRGGGARIRAIGTGNETKLVLANQDSIGYAFYSVEALPNGSVTAPTTALPYKYLELNGVDPIAPASASGVFPLCGSNTAYLCEASTGPVGGVTAFNSFEHLRDGTYNSWSLYRAVTTPGSTDQTNMQQLIDVAQPVVDEALPDFVPLVPHCAGSTLTPGSVSGTLTLNGRTTYHFDEPGLEVFRSHYTQSTITGANGAIFGSDAACSDATWHAAFVGGTTEAGGDVGGLIIHVGNAVPSMSEITDTEHRQ